MSETEQFYQRMQTLFGGDVPWGQLHPQQQNEFLFAINLIMQITAIRKG